MLLCASAASAASASFHQDLSRRFLCGQCIMHSRHDPTTQEHKYLKRLLTRELRCRRFHLFHLNLSGAHAACFWSRYVIVSYAHHGMAAEILIVLQLQRTRGFLKVVRRQVADGLHETFFCEFCMVLMRHPTNRA